MNLISDDIKDKKDSFLIEEIRMAITEAVTYTWEQTLLDASAMGTMKRAIELAMKKITTAISSD